MPYNDSGYHLCEDCYREGKRDVLATHSRGHGFTMSFFCALHATEREKWTQYYKNKKLRSAKGEEER